MTTIDNIMALVNALEDQNYLCAQGEKSDCDTAREALRTALTEIFDQLDIQAGSIEAVQAANQRLAAIIQTYPEKDISAQPVREPLSDEQINPLWKKWVGTPRANTSFVRAIERAHGIGGNK